MILIVSIISLALDQLTKYFAPDLVSFFGSDLCDFANPTLNQSGAFSLPIPSPVLAGITAFILVFIVVWLGKNPNLSHWENFSLGMILGGGMGNLLDRLFYGGVQDFISCSFWPTFNLADVFITLGVIVLLLFSILKPKISR